ncbi:MAG: polysaccharide biosynthesis protein [Clostridia bacterium]|nr:polysaccharide biosynthesis protein [Clostridia bacterium]
MSKIKSKQSFIVGAFIISLGGFISKLLGAVYRIPLTNILGGKGMGIYQMVYPLYCILLTVSASGIPTGIARLISSGKAFGVEKTALKLYGIIGLLGSALMYMLSAPLSYAMQENAVQFCCKALSPAVFFVSVLSVIRGYFQGKGNMIPTAVTEISEQAVKVAIGCIFAYVNRANLTRAVASTLFAVTLAEGVTTIGAIFYYLGHSTEVKPLFKPKQAPVLAILKYTIPLTFTAIAMPLSQLLESVVAVRLLKQITQNATAIYGVYSGCALTIINLPVSVTYGLAAASVPQISPLAAKGNMALAKRKAYKALLITLAISFPCSVALYFLSPVAANLIFKNLSASEKTLLINLVKIMAINAVTSSLVQTSSACITALGKPFKSTISQWVSSFLRVILTALLIKFTSLSILGAAISANCAYLVAVILNFWYIIREGAHHENNAYRFRNGR